MSYFSEGETERLIQIYHENESLYDRNHHEYHNRIVRKRIVGEIADLLGKHENDVVSKIDGLRTQFASSLRRSCKEKGDADRELEGSARKKWRWFEALSFLEPHMTVRVTLKDLEDVDAETFGEDVQCSIVHTHTGSMESEHLYTKPKKPKKKRKIREAQHAVEDDFHNNHVRILPIQAPAEDDCDIFGKLVASELKGMDAEERVFKKRQITGILYS